MTEAADNQPIYEEGHSLNLPLTEASAINELIVNPSILIFDKEDFINLAEKLARNEELRKRIENGEIILKHISKGKELKEGIIGIDPIKDDHELAEIVEKWLQGLYGDEEYPSEVGYRYWNSILNKKMNEVSIGLMLKKGRGKEKHIHTIELRKGVSSLRKALYLGLAGAILLGIAGGVIYYGLAPSIDGLKVQKYGEEGVVGVYAKIRNSQFLNKAFVEAYGKTFQLRKLSNDLFGVNISVPNPEKMDATFFEIETIPSTSIMRNVNMKVRVNWSLDDVLKYWSSKNGLSSTYALALRNKAPHLIQELYFNETNKEKILKNLVYLAQANATLPIEKNFAYKILDNILRDGNAKNKLKVLGKAIGIAVNGKIFGSKSKEGVWAIGNYSIAVSENGYSELDPEVIKLMVDSLNKNPELGDFSPNLQIKTKRVQMEEKFNHPFDFWYLGELVYNNKSRVDSYPFAANAYVKRVDKLITQFLEEGPGKYRWEEVKKALMDNWNFQVNIYEKREKGLPLDKKMLLNLFETEDEVNLILRVSLMPLDAFFSKIYDTPGLWKRIEGIDGIFSKKNMMIDNFISNVKNLDEIHEIVMKTLKYRANSSEDLHTFLTEVLAIPSEYGYGLAYVMAACLKHPDPVKYLIISWNRWVTDLKDYTKLIDTSSKYKEIILNKGTPIPYFNVSIRGNEELEPEDINVGDRPSTGLAKTIFKDGSPLTFEQLGAFLGGLGFYSKNGPEENRVPASILLGWSIGYPIVYYAVKFTPENPYFPLGHGDIGIFLTSKTVNELRNSENILDLKKDYKLPFYVTNGWVFDKYLADKDVLGFYIDLYYPAPFIKVSTKYLDKW